MKIPVNRRYYSVHVLHMYEASHRLRVRNLTENIYVIIARPIMQGKSASWSYEGIYAPD